MCESATVFVVDDAPDLRQSLCWLIEGAGFIVREYDTAEQLLAAYDSRMRGCLIADIRMPGMSGFELLQQVQRRGYKLPVILTSACTDQATSQKAVEHGAVAFLAKPAKRSVVIDRINDALSLGGRLAEPSTTPGDSGQAAAMNVP